MRLERERDDGQSEFWEAKLKVKSKSLEITSGIVHVRHKRVTKAYASAAAARAALARFEAEKREAGYSERVPLGSGFLPSPIPANAALEQTIRETPDDPGPYGVYADWLQAQGSPAGELVALAAVLERKRDARKQKRLDELVRSIKLPSAKFATWGYRHGFFRWLRLENAQDWMASDFDATAFAHKLFATPLCAGLHELRIGVLRWDLNASDVPAVIAAAGTYGWSKGLARLHLGDVENIDMAHHVIGDVGRVISKAFPGLRELVLHSGSQTWRGGGETFGIGGLALPRLETLVIETCSLTKARLADLFKGKLPAVTKLELWFGSRTRDSDVEAADLAKLFTGSVFARVTDLGLCNQELGGELIDRLRASPLAARLVRLDLSRGVVDDDAAAALARSAHRFPALRELDVDDNFLTGAGLAVLRRAFPQATVASQDQDKLTWADPGDRFASIHE